MTAPVNAAVRAVPRQFTQLKLASQFVVLGAGLFVGTRERLHNRSLWLENEKKQWARNAARKAEEQRKTKEAHVQKYGEQPTLPGSTGLAAMVPEGPARDTVVELQKAFESASH